MLDLKEMFEIFIWRSKICKLVVDRATGKKSKGFGFAFEMPNKIEAQEIRRRHQDGAGPQTR